MAFESAKAFGTGRKDMRPIKKNLLIENYKGSDILPNEAARTAVKFWIYQRGDLVDSYKVSDVDEINHTVLVETLYDSWILALSDDWTTVIGSEYTNANTRVPTSFVTY